MPRTGVVQEQSALDKAWTIRNDNRMMTVDGMSARGGAVLSMCLQSSPVPPIS